MRHIQDIMKKILSPVSFKSSHSFFEFFLLHCQFDLISTNFSVEIICLSGSYCCPSGLWILPSFPLLTTLLFMLFFLFWGLFSPSPLLSSSFFFLLSFFYSLLVPSPIFFIIPYDDIKFVARAESALQFRSASRLHQTQIQMDLRYLLTSHHIISHNIILFFSLFLSFSV